MTRRHFQVAAQIVKLEIPEPHKRIVAEAYVMLFRGFNPQFSPEKFYAACGLDNKEVR